MYYYWNSVTLLVYMCLFDTIFSCYKFLSVANVFFLLSLGAVDSCGVYTWVAET